ncbi:MAG: catalase-peroxidase [Limisphaera sp.]|nr:MAG: catalase-peroxidase [Limisphaera sp.]
MTAAAAAGAASNVSPRSTVWPDNVSLDKARRLLWPIKQKYGRKISWADLMILAGNVALETMGFKTLGFAGGREDTGNRTWTSTGARNPSGSRTSATPAIAQLENPLAAVQMGLIYVNPEGPNGNPDPVAAARDIRETFRRMAMNDEETVALIAGGHTFGKTHGAGPASHVGPRTGGRPDRAAGPRLEEHLPFRQGTRHHHQRSRGHLDPDAHQVEPLLPREPLQIRVGADQEPRRRMAVGRQGRPGDHPGRLRPQQEAQTHHAHHGSGPALRSGLRKYRPALPANPDEFAQAFARAWFKLTHRDMGPRSRYLGPEVPQEEFLWQDPIPPVDHPLIDEADMARLKQRLLNSGLSIRELVYTAWSAASTFRGSDKRGGANGARIRLAPQKFWEANEPEQLAKVLGVLEQIQKEFNGSAQNGKKVSLADLIVLGGCAAVEEAARKAGYNITVPFHPGRTDASQEQTDVESFAVLEPYADGFRNYQKKEYSIPAEYFLVDKAQLLTLTAPEMTVLIGGLRVLGANYKNNPDGVFTRRPGVLTNDFFVNLLDMSTEWKRLDERGTRFEGRDRKTGELRWTATRVDLVFGADSRLRAVAEVYGAADGEEKFVRDFARAWSKVMHLDRFELKRNGALPN